MISTWITRSFDAFRAGSFGNGGQNLYVSRAGVLQRIFHFDLNGDGFVDLVFCNSQNHSECPPVYVYRDIFGDRQVSELPSNSAMSGIIADLNGDGYDDLVLAMHDNGVRQDLNSIIYYGSPDGWSERLLQQLPTPLATAVVAGDFNGDGKMDLAFLCNGRVRLFAQNELGFEPKRFVDLDITGHQLAAHDLDDDGCAELIVRQRDGGVTIYWGGKDGISADHATDVPCRPDTADFVSGDSPQAQYAEYIDAPAPLPCVICLHNQPHLFIAAKAHAWLLPVLPGRQFSEPLTFGCPNALAVAAGSLEGNGFADLVFACQGESSWVYWGSSDGFSESRRTPLPTYQACAVAVADLDGDGKDEVVFCQGADAETFDVDSIAYAVSPDGLRREPVKLPSHDARRVLISGDRVIFVNHFSGGVLGNAPIAIYWGGPDGFTPERRQELPAWGAVEALYCDFNDDGRPDIVFANASENSVASDPGSYVYLNGPEGFPATPSLALPTLRAHGVCCADLNRDGYLDLVFCGFNNPDITIFYGTADGFDIEHPVRLRLEIDGVVYQEARWPYLVDLNGDGWLDLVVPQIVSDRSLILWGGPEGFSIERRQLLSVERAACARAADFTGNGYPDLVIAGHMPQEHGPHDTFACIYWNGPDGLREDRKTMLPTFGANSMSIADFNNDGLLDLFVSSYHNGRERDIDSYIYWQRPGRGFSAYDRTRLFTHSASGSLAADFNEDGWVDLAVANHKVWGDHHGYSAAWWNGPRGFSEERQTHLPTTGPHGITAIEPGNLLDRGPEEYYESVPHELPTGARVTGIAWEADTPPKTWVKAQLRVADSCGGLTSAPWQGWYENGASLDLHGRWVQYRLALGAINAVTTPRVRQVDVRTGSADHDRPGGTIF